MQVGRAVWIPNNLPCREKKNAFFETYIMVFRIMDVHFFA